jgi:hypothetical protein
MAERGLHDHVGYWLRRLSDEVHTSFERQIAARGVTVAQSPAQPHRGGQALVPDLIRIADENDEAFFGTLPAGERAALMRLLQQLLPAVPTASVEASHA